MPPRYTSNFTCPSCGLQVKLSRNTAVVTKKKSKKKQAIGRRLAASLPRDERGRFLPAGSSNRYKKKTRKRSSRKGKERVTKRRRPEVTEEDEILGLFPDETFTLLP